MPALNAPERPAPTVLFHVDIDSPATLLRFWGHDRSSDVDAFYRTAMTRSLDLFAKLGVPATYFCVGSELEASAEARDRILAAHRAGHEIANHTHTHPYGFTALSSDAMARELDRCGRVIEDLTGVAPVGFRAPSYDVNAQTLELLRERGYAYDTSASWNSLMPLVKFYYALFARKHTRLEFGSGEARIPRRPYVPSRSDWMREDPSSDGLVELPVTRTSWLHLPFYNNFLLAAGPWYRTLALCGKGPEVMVYLIHLIEFVDLRDGLQEELSVHPNVRTPSTRKIAFLEETMRQLLRHYQAERTDRFARHWQSRRASVESSR